MRIEPYYLYEIYSMLFFIGSSSGIGAATAKLFVRFGAQVAITGRNADNLNKVAKECEVDGQKVVTTITKPYTKQCFC